MPFLGTIGGGSSRGHGRGLGGGGAALWDSISFNWVAGASGRAYPGTQAQYASISTIPLASNYAFSSGYHYFDIGAGTYTVDIRGAEGSGTKHGYGAKLTATLVVSQLTRLVAIVGNPGSGNYSGGGMSALAIRSDATDVYTNATPLLVAGGGGGGYSIQGGQADAGDTTWTSTTRRTNNTDCPTYGGGVYDAGAGFDNAFHAVSTYSCTVDTNTQAKGFRNGAIGGRVTACGSDQGGFGGGGGSCPGGGGGYYGGLAGGNAPSPIGGGGGTSYRLSSGSIAYISSWSDNGTNGSTRDTQPGTAGGYLSIIKA